MKYLALVMTLSWLCFSSAANNYVFEKISTRNGLSQNDVNCIFQDKAGFLWIGTNDGLNLYDGYSFKTFRTSPDDSLQNGLTSNLIYKIIQDAQGLLWLATSNEGLCIFNPQNETFRSIRNTADSPHILSDNRILDLHYAQDSTIWVATPKGVNFINPRQNYSSQNVKSLSSSVFANRGCNTITQDHYNRIWMGFFRGLAYCKGRHDAYKIKTIHFFDSINVKQVLPSPHGMFISSESGLFFLPFSEGKIMTDQLHQIAPKPSSTIYLDQPQKILYASVLQKLHIYSCDFDTNNFQLAAQVDQGESENELSSNLIMSIMGDRSGIIWIGTNGGGLNKYNPNRKKFELYRHTLHPGSLSGNKIRVIYEDSQHNLWVGTEGGGLCYLNANRKNDFDKGFLNIAIHDSKTENRIFSILENDDEIWVGGGYPQKFIRIKNNFPPRVMPNSMPLTDIKASIFAMTKDQYGNIWAGTYGNDGLYRLTPKQGNYSYEVFHAENRTGGLSSNIIRSLLCDTQGNLWIGTDDGLNILPRNETKDEHPHFISYHHQENASSLSNDYILPIFEDSKHRIWIGTMGGGLNLANTGKGLDQIHFDRFTTCTGLPNNVIKAILEDDQGNLWISSNHGLSRFNPEKHQMFNFDISDGLQDNEFSELAACKRSDGLFIFGGVKGFNTFYPENIFIDSTAPTVVFTELEVLNRPVKVGEIIHKRPLLPQHINHTPTIHLKYSENSFTLHFAALHFASPGKNHYKYRLKGFDKEWIVQNADNRQAKYTNLNPGTYIFELYASNNDQIWTDKPRTLRITVAPPWYLTPLAWISYLVLMVLFFIFFHRYSFIRVQRKNELLLEHSQKEKLEELTRMKLRFFANISHEFRTPLTLIIGAARRLEEYETHLSNNLRQALHSVLRNSSFLLRLTNQLMEFSRMEQDKLELQVQKIELISFTRDIYQSFCEVAERKNIHFTFHSDQENLLAWVDADKLEKIIYNLLSNAFKFTPSGGHVEVCIASNDTHITIRVKDSGIGIPEDVYDQIFERFYQYKPDLENGTGIGLSYAKGLAQLHKGDITVKSAEGVGSTFQLVLKRGKEHYSPSDFIKIENPIIPPMQADNLPYQTSSFMHFNRTPFVSTGQRVVLIVEDNLELLEFLKSCMAEHYSVLTACNGKEAIELLPQYPIELIISDVAMPVMNGYELCHALKTSNQHNHIPIILLTARTSAQDSVKGFEAGADAYVNKPFEMSVLMAQMAALLRNYDKQKENRDIRISPSAVNVSNEKEQFLLQLASIIENNVSNPNFSVKDLAKEVNMTATTLNQKIKKLSGLTTRLFIRDIRLKRAAQLLSTGQYTVSQVTYEVGFSDLKHFRHCFKETFGVTPSAYTKLEMESKRVHQK